jgi:hypothetical protein
MKNLTTAFFILLAMQANAQYVEWEDLFRIFKAPEAAKENATLDLGFDFEKSYTNTGTKQLCTSYKRVMIGNEGEWDEFISYCKGGSVITYKSENSSQYQRLRKEIVSRMGFRESESAGLADGGLKTTFVSGTSKIQFYSTRDKVGKANNIIAIISLDAEPALAKTQPALTKPEQQVAARNEKSEEKNVNNEEVEGGRIPKYYALFIGINNYQYAGAELQSLNKPVSDATSFKDVLISRYAFKPEYASLLANPTRAEIIRALEDLAKKVTEKDNLLIFYAGHGVWDKRLNVGYWLPADSKPGDKGNWIANSTVRDYIAGIQSRHTLLITDACFGGSIFKTREVTTEINEYGVAKIYQLPSRKAMTSGTLTTVPDESKFMKYLIKRLEENTSKYLTTRQLFFSVETAVLNNTSTVPQLGVIQETGDEGGDFIFIKN